MKVRMAYGFIAERRRSNAHRAGQRRQQHDDTSSAVSDRLMASAPVEQVLAPQEAHQQADPEEEEEDEDVAYDEPAPEELLAPPDFRPFFTLIEDPETGEHHHPNVHYLFSDDDPELLTNAALEAIATGQAAGAGQKPDQEERIVILDMASDGKEVASATCLSPHWQALTTTVTQAPSWGSDTAATNRGWMLKISGQEAQSVWGFKDKVGLSGEPEELARMFNEKMQRLNDIMGYEVKDTDAQRPSLGMSSND